MLNPDQKELVSFTQEYGDKLPAQRRIKVYRGLADGLGSDPVAALFVSRALILEDAERRCAELNLIFPTTHNPTNQ